MYYDKETRAMVNQSVNEFYTRFLFKIYALPQDIVLPIDILETLFNNLSLYLKELLIQEGVQVTPSLSTETSHQGNERLVLFQNAAVEA